MSCDSNISPSAQPCNPGPPRPGRCWRVRTKWKIPEKLPMTPVERPREEEAKPGRQQNRLHASQPRYTWRGWMSYVNQCSYLTILLVTPLTHQVLKLQILFTSQRCNQATKFTWIYLTANKLCRRITNFTSWLQINVVDFVWFILNLLNLIYFDSLRQLKC